MLSEINVLWTSIIVSMFVMYGNNEVWDQAKVNVVMICVSTYSLERSSDAKNSFSPED